MTSKNNPHNIIRLDFYFYLVLMWQEFDIVETLVSIIQTFRRITNVWIILTLFEGYLNSSMSFITILSQCDNYLGRYGLLLCI